MIPYPQSFMQMAGAGHYVGSHQYQQPLTHIPANHSHMTSTSPDHTKRPLRMRSLSPSRESSDYVDIAKEIRTLEKHEPTLNNNIPMSVDAHEPFTDDYDHIQHALHDPFPEDDLITKSLKRQDIKSDDKLGSEEPNKKQKGCSKAGNDAKDQERTHSSSQRKL